MPSGRVGSVGETVPPSVSVAVTPCCAGYRPVKNVLRLGEHIAALQQQPSNVSPVSARRLRFGRFVSAQPSGQNIGARS